MKFLVHIIVFFILIFLLMNSANSNLQLELEEMGFLAEHIKLALRVSSNREEAINTYEFNIIYYKHNTYDRRSLFCRCY